jgi:hypothetical protein
MKFRFILLSTLLSCGAACAAEKKVLATIEEIEDYGTATRLWLSNITGDGAADVPLGTGNFYQDSSQHRFLNFSPTNPDVWKRFLSIALTAKSTGAKVWLLWDAAIGDGKSISAMKLQ